MNPLYFYLKDSDRDRVQDKGMGTVFDIFCGLCLPDPSTFTQLDWHVPYYLFFFHPMDIYTLRVRDPLRTS